MSIFRVHLTLGSETLTSRELAAIAGAEPGRSFERGDRVSPRLPITKVRTYSMCDFGSGIEQETWYLETHWPAIAKILETVAAGPARSDFELDLTIATNARSMGYVFDLLPEQIALMARAHCALRVDSYSNGGKDGKLPDDYPCTDELASP